MLNLLSRKRTLKSADFFSGLTDCHSHILPGVDDGIKSEEEALKVLAEYETMGVERVILTPHIMELYSSNDARSLISRFDEFKKVYFGKIKLSLGAEYMLDSGFEEHLSSGKLLTLWDNYLLVETSYLQPPTNMLETLCEIRSKGYFVVLAHPERYGYMQRDKYGELKRDGVLFQLNLLSLSGYYGRQVRDTALYLLKNDMYDLIGSDLHNLRAFKEWMPAIKLAPKLMAKLQRLKKVKINSI
ncbi:MAG: CpsB/CapC family capsule biosynthesis tyrosine phosphatase [Rikenellaceae bacterium]